MGSTVHTKTCIFTYFYRQYLVLFTMASRNSVGVHPWHAAHVDAAYKVEAVIRRDGVEQ